MPESDREDRRVQEVMELTSAMMNRYYHNNDVEFVIAQMDEDIVWLGTAEHEFAVGREIVSGIFRRFAGQVPKCNISEEEYHVLRMGPDAYLCSGRMWIATDASTGISLRVHQRVTMGFRQAESGLRCCHIHISNPYGEMADDDVGFPTKMARQSYEYLQERVAAQTSALRRMSYEDTLTGLFNRNKFNQVVDVQRESGPLGIACFDLNGLKETNDRMGHSAGDELLCKVAGELRKVFGDKAYRIGGDEFVVVDDTLEETAFQDAVRAAEEGMAAVGICCSVGASWRAGPVCVREQLDEADRRMYEAKRRYYSVQAHDRRNRPREPRQQEGPAT